MPRMPFDARTPLYTSDAHAWSLDQLPAALDTLEAAGRPLVLFVHGRGKEPGKSLKGGTVATGKAVHKIERGYDVRVLMFNWDSAFHGFNLFDREVPLAHTDAGAQALGRVLAALERRRAERPAARPMTMLVHSMGSIVIQKTIEQGLWPAAPGLFSCVLFSQPDADDVGHAAWLDRLAAAEKVYVTWNRDDKVLHRSTDARPAGRHALGLGTAEPLAPRATYVDLSRMGALGDKDEDHEVFGKGAMNGQLHVCEFFVEALTGQPVLLDLGRNVESVEREVVFRLKSRQEPGHPLLKVPELPEF